jgi:hypothetical protein
MTNCSAAGILSIAHHVRSIDSAHLADRRWVSTERLEAVSDFAWVARLPCAHRQRVALCLKGPRCAAVQERVARTIRPATLHSCVEEPAGRANGTEAVCALRFLLDNAAKPDWRGVVFLHSDVAANPSHSGVFDALSTFLARAEWPRWPRDRPPSEREAGCQLMVEPGFQRGRYNYWSAMTWWMHSFLQPAAGAHVASQRTVHWPLSFMFHLDRSTASLRSRSFLFALYRLARRGVHVPELKLQLGPDAWGHAMERLPFYAFSSAYAPRSRPLSRCRALRRAPVMCPVEGKRLPPARKT